MAFAHSIRRGVSRSIYRGTGRAAVNAMTASYSHIIRTAEDDGYDLYGSGWIFDPPALSLALAYGFSNTGGVSFGNVNLAANESIALALLKVNVIAVLTADTFTCFLENPQATSQRWEVGHVPDVSTTPRAGSDITGIDGTLGWKFLNVTSQVQAAVDDADWESGDWLNFGFQTTNDTGNLQLGGVGTASSNNPAELMIITTSDTYIGTDIEDLADSGFTNISFWETTGSPTVTGGAATIPSGATIKDADVTIEPNTFYYLTHQGSTGGISPVSLAGGTAVNTNVAAGTKIGVFSGSDTGAGMVFSQSAGTPVLTGPITLEKVESYDTLIHLDPTNIGAFTETGGLWDDSAASGGYPIWAGDGTLQIRTHTTGNGTARMETAAGFGVFGFVPGSTYRCRWKAISNPSNTSFQIDCGSSKESNFGTPAYTEHSISGNSSVRPDSLYQLAYAGDSDKSGGVNGVVTFTQPMTITRVP